MEKKEKLLDHVAMGVYCWQSVVVPSYGVSTCESLRPDHAPIASITSDLRAAHHSKLI
jgi:hypothetical protein